MGSGEAEDLKDEPASCIKIIIIYECIEIYIYIYTNIILYKDTCISLCIVQYVAIYNVPVNRYDYIYNLLRTIYKIY